MHEKLLSPLRNRTRAILADPAFRWSVTVTVGVRVGLSVLAIAVWLAGLVPTTADPVLRPYFEVPPVTGGLPGVVFGVWQRFDVINYQRVALHGYSSPELSTFFPLLPLLMRAFALFWGGDTLLAGLLTANLCCLAALYLLFTVIVEEGLGVATARRAVVYLACFPVAFFLFVPYTESLLLACALYTVREVRRGNWLRAGLAAALAALVRPQGICLAVVLAWELGRQNDWRVRRMLRWQATAILWPGLCLGLFLLWRWWSGYPPLTEVQMHWNRVAAIPGEAIIWTVQRMAGGEANLVEYFDLLCVVLMLGLGVAAIKRLPAAYTLYTWAVLFLNLASPQLHQPLSGQMRFSLMVFPAFILLGRAGRHPIIHRLILYPSVAGLLFWTGQFVMWGWAG